MLDFSFLKDVIFFFFIISNICISIGFNMLYIYFLDWVYEYGINKIDVINLIFVIGIVNTIGRVVFGWMADKLWVNRLMFYNILLFICGLVIVFFFFNNSYFFLVCYVVVFGVFIGMM